MSGKTKMVSFRLTEKEYKEISGRIPISDSGKPIMKFSTFIRGAISEKRLVAVDREVEQYKVHAASKIGNNVNQIAKRLNEDNLNDLITPATYDGVLDNLEEIKKELKELLAPLK